MSAHLIALAALIGGCSTPAQRHANTSAPPWRVCGHTLYSAPAGPVIVDASRWSSTRTITQVSLGDALYIRFTPACSDGVRVQFLPATAARIQRAAEGTDGLLGVIIKPYRTRFDIRLLRSGGATQLLRVRLR